MSTLFVANVAFLANDNSQITYLNNSISITAGGNAAFIANSTAITIANPPTSTGGGTSVANDTLTYTTSQTASSLTTNGQVIISGNVSPTLLSASTADWNPLFGNAYFIKVSSNTALSIYGMVEGTNGQIVVLNNIGNSAITLTNEDAANETTAGRRFQLPDNITVYPFSSISLVYDGISARWKAQNSIGINATPLNNVKGFQNGGALAAPSVASTSDRTTFSTETNAAVTGTNFSIIKTQTMSAGNACKGFFGGGFNSPIVYSTVERITYSSETNAVVAGVNLSPEKRAGSALGNSCKGFFVGGIIAAPLSSVLTSAERITYSTETNVSAPGANLISPRNSFTATGNSCKGFAAAGTSTAPTVISSTDRITYATETFAAVPGANLSLNRRCIGAIRTFCKGFFAGGFEQGVPIAITTAERITYATETNAVVSGANLIQARSLSRQMTGNVCKGFFNGGGTTPAQVSTSERITYSTETNAATPGANLSQDRSGGSTI